MALAAQLALAFHLPVPHRVEVLPMRAPAVVMEKGREAEDVAGAVGNTFGDVFASFFKPNAEKQAEIDRAYAEQLEVAAMRKDPEGYRRRLKATEERRRRESEEWRDKFAWQKGDNPLQEFLKRKKEGKIAPIGYEDEPKGGIPLPSASFGVGGEFGVGGKFDNGMRFDLRLPFAEQGWVDESELAPGAGKGKGRNSRLGTGSTEDKKKRAAAKKQRQPQDNAAPAESELAPDAPWYAKLAFEMGKFGREK